MEGSTDITRTFAFGKLSDQMKEDFTTVLKCNLHLARAVFSMVLQDTTLMFWQESLHGNAVLTSTTVPDMALDT